MRDSPGSEPSARGEKETGYIQGGVYSYFSRVDVTVKFELEISHQSNSKYFCTPEYVLVEI